MKPIFATLLAATLAAATANAIEPTVTLEDTYPGVMNSALTVDGKARLMVQNVQIDNEYHYHIASIKLLDTDLNELKTITLPTVSTPAGYTSENLQDSGDWEVFEDRYDYVLSVAEPYYISANGQSSYGILTQNFFNNDEAFEFIMPTVQPTTETEQRDYDGDGVIDYISTHYTYDITGYEVRSENGTKLSTLSLPAGFNVSDVTLLDLGSAKYVVISGYTGDTGKSADSVERKSYTFYYKVESGASSLKLARSEEGTMSVRNNTAAREITIIPGEEGDFDSVTLFDAAGRMVRGANAVVNDGAITLSTASLAPGTYIVNAVGREKRESVKVTIR